MYLQSAGELISKSPEISYLVEKQCVFLEGLIDEGYERNVRDDLCPQSEFNPGNCFTNLDFRLLHFLKMRPLVQYTASKKSQSHLVPRKQPVIRPCGQIMLLSHRWDSPELQIS